MTKNVLRQDMRVSKASRSERMNQRPVLIWLTGLSASGKTTIAAALELELFLRGFRTYMLDGDDIRHGLCKDLEFSEADRTENIRRVGEVAALMLDAGLIVIASFISPIRKDRKMVRGMLEQGEFIEVYLSTPLEICEERDPKGLYKKARNRRIPAFTGISSPYEPPESPDVVIDSSEISVEEGVKRIIDALKYMRII